MKMKQFIHFSYLILFCFIMSNGIPAVTVFAESEANHFQVGDRILFGTYPQSRVTDNALIPILDTADKTWKSYDYYSGTGDWGDGKMVPGDYMQFADFMVGQEKYRAVVFHEFRPSRTSFPCGSSYSFQDENGYTPETVYYFRYEPLSWKILTLSGYVICENCVDSQAYQNTIYYSESECWQDSSQSRYSSDYSHSSIREWLNRDFYETAFSDAQKDNIQPIMLNSEASLPSAQLASAEEYDKIFLLSEEEMHNTAFGFKPSLESPDPARCATGTDYSKIQGLSIYRKSGSQYDQNSWWWLRSENDDPDGAPYITYSGDADGSLYVGYTGGGIRPSCVLVDLNSDDSLSETLYSELISDEFASDELMIINDVPEVPCEYCDDVHPNTFVGKIIQFYHKIVLLFLQLFEK